MITLEYEGGIKSVSSEPVEIESLTSEHVVTETIDSISNLKRVRIIPKIKSDSKIINCEDKETVVVWREVDVCS